MNTFDSRQGKRSQRPPPVNRTWPEQKSGDGLGRWEAAIPNPKLKLMEQVKEVMRVKYHLRFLEALRLRLQDLDFGMKQLTVRDGKGAKDRYPSICVHLRTKFFLLRAFAFPRELFGSVACGYPLTP
jgi:hypothetical protein